MKRFFLHILLMSICVTSLSGCLTLLGMGASAGGSYIASREFNKAKKKQNRAVERKAVREARVDWEREQKLITKNDEKIDFFLNKELLSGGLTKVLAVHTKVQNGVVTLFGNVPSTVVEERAINVARKIKGVKKVISRLIVVDVKILPYSVEPSPLGSTTPETFVPNIEERNTLIEKYSDNDSGYKEKSIMRTKAGI